MSYLTNMVKPPKNNYIRFNDLETTDTFYLPNDTDLYIKGETLAGEEGMFNLHTGIFDIEDDNGHEIGEINPAVIPIKTQLVGNNEKSPKGYPGFPPGGGV